MGIAIPQVITPSKASGAQLIDGSLKFDDNYLTRTPGSEGSLKSWTWSAWVKPDRVSGNLQQLFEAKSDGTNYDAIYFTNGQKLEYELYRSSQQAVKITNRVFRDTGWYHLVVVYDAANSTAADRVRIYVNGERETSFSSSTNPDTTDNSFVNDNSIVHQIGDGQASNQEYDGRLSQVYLIDGQALDASYFGFTDPLTNTWKPKKFSGNFTQSSANDGTTWSSSVSGPVNSSKPLSLLFGGTIGSGYQNGTTPTSGNTLTFDISSKNLTVTNVRLNTFISTGPGGGGTPNTFTLNGTTVPIADSDGDQTHVVAVNGQLNTIAWSYDSGNGPYVYMRGIEVDLGGGLGYELLTDGINNTGANSFYLPMDGNSPIGEDKSGQGNDWTPVNFGGSVELDNPQVSGARPILNTTPGGTQAGVGVFGSKQNVGYAVTVYNDGGGNKYYIDGVKQDTVTGLIRGATYTFDTSDSTVSSHPFRFSATSNGSHGGGSEYTNGVAAITGAATTITVPHDAPNTLYYYCTSHSGMGADITGITTNEKLADQYASSCVLALPLIFRDMGDVSASITCTRTNSSVSNNGNVADTGEQSNFYNRSFEFDGSGDSLSVSSSSDFGMGTGDFTIEAWVYPTSLASSDFIVCLSGSDSVFGYDSDGSLNLQLPSSGAPALTQLGPKIAANKWNHFAAVRESGNLRGYVDGVLAATVSNATTNMGASGTVTVGDHPSLSREITGYLQDVRIYKGVAKYTSDFVVPSTSPDILPDIPSGVSGGSKLTKITDGAISLDGSGDCLTVADDADFEFGSGDFTLEAFIYYTGNPGTSNNTYAIFSKWDNQSAPNDKGFILRISDDGSGDNLQWFYTTDGSTNLITTGSTLLNPNNWYHIAFVRNGSYGTFYVNGVADATVVSFGSNSIRDTGNAFRIGANLGSGSVVQEFSGFISNVRVVKGTAVYTGNRFTPPAAPLTNVTNTKLLCCQSNAQAGAAATAPNMGGVNDGTQWSAFASSNAAFSTSSTIQKAFDGDASTKANTAANTGYSQTNNYDNAIEFVPPDPIPYSSSIKVIGRNTGQTTMGVKIDTGSGYGSEIALSSDNLQTVVSGSGNLVRMQVVTKTYSGENELGGIQIDGVYLTDPVAPIGDAVATNFNPFNTDINTVRGQESGYATLNPLSKSSGTTFTLSDGNLTLNAEDVGMEATLRASTGKFYFETKLIDWHSNGDFICSVGAGTVPERGGNGGANLYYPAYTGYTGTSGVRIGFSGTAQGIFSLGTQTLVKNTGWALGDMIGVAVDCDRKKLQIYYNGAKLGDECDLPSGESEFSFYAFAQGTGGDPSEIEVNFGQKPFKFPPPDGFQPLNTANTRPVNVISRPDQYVGVTTYTGDGNSSGRRINIGFRPDLIWLKSRGSGNHGLYDSVRGPDKRLQADNTAAEDTVVFPGASNFGFDFGSETYYNGSSTNYVAWTWKAGGNKNTFNVDDVGYATAAAAGLTAGSVTPTGASVGTKQGFSIIKWTAPDPQDNSATIPHGLTQKPDLWAIKSLDGSRDWIVYTEQVDGSLDFTHFNNTDAKADSSATAPTATTFGVYGSDINTAGEEIIAYLWHDVPGLQKFGRYEGNTTIPAFIETGFRPAIIWIKAVDQTWYWNCQDAERSPINPSKGNFIQFNISGAEGVASGNNNLDILSNGFKIRSTTAQSEPTNVNSQTYIWGAWAEAPLVDLFGGGANAR